MKIKQMICSPAFLSLIAGSYLAALCVVAIGKFNDYRQGDAVIIFLLFILGLAAVFILYRFRKLENKAYELKTARAVFEAQENERRVLGAELHDNVGQLLLTTQLYLSMAINSKDQEQERHLGETKKLLMQAAIEVRNISHRMAPAFLDYIPLTDAISDLLKSINPDNRFDIGFEFGNGIPCASISPEIKLTIYRILQEQLKNILAHSQATEVKLRLTVEGNRVCLVVADNGIGFDTGKCKPGIGLLNIRRRLEQFSGKFSIDAAPQKGCCITIEIPLLTGRPA